MTTNYTVGSGGMIMRTGCDTGYNVRDGNIYKSGSFTDLSVDNGGRILKSGSDTGFTIGSGGTIMKDSDKGYSLDWMFN